MRFCDSEMIEHRERIRIEMPVGVNVGRRRHVGGRIAARRIRDAAVAAREVTHLRLPIGVVGREFMQEDDRRSQARLFEMQTDMILGHGIGHLRFLFSCFGVSRPRKSQLMRAAAMRQHWFFFVIK